MDIGTFDTTAASAPFSVIELLVQAQDIQDRWQRCNMLANYIAEYVAYQFLAREWAENLISTVTNEFLEAVACLSPGCAALTLRCTQYASTMQIEIEHSVQPNALQPYLTFLSELSGTTIGDLYFRLVMLVHDFHARVAARLDDATGQIRIQVSVPTKEISA